LERSEGFRLTILGSGPAAPNPGGANSGYLVRFGETALVMDCGPGTAGRIPLHVPVNQLDGIFISHLHPDHYFDLVATYYSLKFGEGRATRLPLWVPPGGRQFLDHLGRLITSRPAFLEDIFEVCDYSPDSQVRVGQLTIAFHPVQHFILSHALRLQSPTKQVLVFSSDVAPCPELIEAARGADLFLCESALMEASEDEPDPKRRGHLSAREAGEAARAAGAKRLVITHCRSNADADRHHLSTARQAFDGPIELAREGETYIIQ
jgi:ribonuclease BN (tRNA processing enzyme)